MINEIYTRMKRKIEFIFSNGMERRLRGGEKTIGFIKCEENEGDFVNL